jgi:hypothetical protein
MNSHPRPHANFWGVRQEKKTIRGAARVFSVCKGPSSRGCSPWPSEAARPPAKGAGSLGERSMAGRHLAPRKLAARREACFQGEATVNCTDQCLLESTQALPGLRCFREGTWK